MADVTNGEKKKLLVEALPEYVPEIGRCLWMLEDARQRTYETLDGLQVEAIDFVAFEGCNTIGTLLYHLAAIEMDWLYNEVMEGQMADAVWESFEYPVRDEQSRLTRIEDFTLAEHFRLLDSTRASLLKAFEGMTLEDFRRPRQLTEYDVTPEWVLYHLMQHEALHRGEMATVRTIAEQALGLD